MTARCPFCHRLLPVVTNAYGLKLRLPTHRGLFCEGSRKEIKAEMAPSTVPLPRKVRR